MPMSRIARRTLLLAAAAVAVGVACTTPASGGPPAPPPSPAEVEATRAELDRRAPSVPSSVASWGVDPAVGLVVVSVTGPRTPEVDRFLSDLDPRTLRVDTGAEAPRPMPGGRPGVGSP